MIALWHSLPENFEEQLAAIGTRAEAYHVDDGGDDALRAAAGFEALGLRGVFFIITNRIGTEGSVTSEMIRELVARGHEIGNHSHTHRMMTQLRAPEIYDEIAMAQAVLHSITGTHPRRFAWPNGRHSQSCDRMADAFGFVEVRDISNVIRRIDLKSIDQIAALFP